MQQWHQMPMQAVLEALHTSSDGLSAAESSHRLAAYGANVLVARKRRTALGMILSQFTDFMVLVLIVAAAISGLIGELQDTLAVVAIVVLNAVVGFVQEYRADRAMEALRAMAAHTATIVREGQMAAVPAAEIVPGDLVVLEAGGIVPADLRLLETARLRVNEASLTGESVPVDKRTEPLEGETLSLGDRTNMAFKGTAVTYGRGRGVVVATGMATEFGKIAGMLQEVGEGATPLQRRLSRFGRALALGALAICALVFAAGILRGEPPLLMFLTAVSLAVAAIPEALPAVVTTTLALGARHMARQQALMRRLSAVETLGSVTYICTDKTGTLTANRMRVEAFYCDGALAHAPGSGSAWEALLRAMALCSDAGPDASGTTIGDPTEVALMVAARDVGVEKHALEQRYPRVAELPFDAHRKCMTTLHRDPAGGFLAVSKGAVEVLLGKSVRMLQEDGPIELHPDQLTRVSESMAAGGLRVLAFGIRRMPVLPAMLCPESVECDLTLLGVVGLVDPPRPEAREAVAQCKSAGIVPIMITGDHSITAQAIARQLGILDSSDEIMTGEELAALSPDDLGTRVEGIRVYARVAPEQKLRIVRALQGRGEIVAMTGDGVNDAEAGRHRGGDGHDGSGCGEGSERHDLAGRQLRHHHPGHPGGTEDL
jgi:Ca2+-transporting ATPase